MKHYFALSAIGKDRPGIVADVAGLIYECGGNLVLTVHKSSVKKYLEVSKRIAEQYPADVAGLGFADHAGAEIQADAPAGLEGVEELAGAAADFEDATAEFGKLIQEEDAAMCEGNFSGLGD